MTFLSYIGDDPAKIRTMADDVFVALNMITTDPKLAISLVGHVEIALRRYAELLENLEEIKENEYERGKERGFNIGYDEGYENGVDR